MKTPKSLEYPEAYNQRDVLTLKPLNQWTQEEELVHLEHNRILQPGFATRTPEELIKNAKLTGEDWLTDICCPSIQGALAIHLAKEMVVTYKVGEDDLNIQNQKAYKLLLDDNPNIKSKLEAKINEKLTENTPPATELEGLARARLQQNNENRIRNNLPELPITEERINAAKAIELDLIRKKFTSEIVDEYIQEQRPRISSALDLKLKDVIKPGQNRDFSFLGAAGSGKSTISRQFLSDSQKENCIIVATDNYRAFSIPGSNEHEKNAGKNVFAKTQDLAYMVKELVQKDISTKTSGRPNIIFDAVTLDSGTKKLLQQGIVTSAVAAYSGAPGLVGIAERADYRARDESASPADKGRFVHTTSLLEGHANASSRLLTSVPDKAITTIYDTNVERGQPAIDIGTINTSTNTMQIKDLRVMSEFLNKKNLNAEAIHQVDLIYNTKNPLNLLSTHPENKAKAILDLVPETRFKPAFTIKMMDKQGIEYAELTSVNGAVKLNVLNTTIFNEKALSETIEGGVLRAITRQVEKGGLEASFNTAFDKGDKNSFKESATKLGVGITDKEPKVKKESFIKKLSAQITDKLAQHKPMNPMQTKPPKQRKPQISTKNNSVVR